MNRRDSIKAAMAGVLGALWPWGAKTSNAELLKLAECHPAPQEWYDEEWMSVVATFDSSFKGEVQVWVNGVELRPILLDCTARGQRVLFMIPKGAKT